MRIVLDTNILVRANVRAQGPARELLTRIIHGDHVLIISPFLLRETARSLAYPRLQELWGLSSQEIREHVDLLERISCVVDPIVGPRVVLTDPNDDPVVYTAVAGRAQVLSTLDHDFFEARVIDFCTGHGISVLTDVQLLERLSLLHP